MKAIVYHEYGSPDVLQYEEIAKPAPATNEVLVAVRAASINPLDWHFMRGDPYLLRLAGGLRRPKITRLGVDLAGQIESVGSGVTKFKPGDEVFGSCRGAFAEYVCTTESALAIKPQNVSFEQAAAAPTVTFTALQALRNLGHIQKGQKVLINGAAGGVGTAAVQLAQWFGADVTGVCSTHNVEMVRSIGASHVVDYTREDFTRNGLHYDIFLDCIGNHSLLACRRVLNSNGRYIMIGGTGGMSSFLARAFIASLWSRLSNKKLSMFLAKRSPEDLALMRDLLESKELMPIIDRRYRLCELPEAIAYLEAGHARGKVIIVS